MTAPQADPFSSEIAGDQKQALPGTPALGGFSQPSAHPPSVGPGLLHRGSPIGGGVLWGVKVWVTLGRVLRGSAWS